MNKVDDEEEIERGMEAMRGWEGSWGVVEALGLWEYERGGRWGFNRRFDLLDGGG